MRLLVIGGSFNPVHWGHLLLAEELLEEFGYDRALFLPAGKPPHKSLQEDPGAEARLDMLRAAVAGDARFLVDPRELERSGPSYTVDSLAELVAAGGLEGKPGLAIGDDLAPGFPSWREPERILELAELVVARRGGGDFALPFPHRRASNRLVPVSSSEIRARAREGRSFRYLVPREVYERIRSGGYYGLR